MNHCEYILLPILTVKNGVLTGCNTIFSELFGYEPHKLNQYRLSDILTINDTDPSRHFDVQQLFIKAQQHNGFTINGLLKNQHHYSLPIELFCRPVAHHTNESYELFFRIIEDKSQDSVTGLPNGWAISSRVNHFLTLPQEQAPRLAVIIFRVDNFSTLNFRQSYSAGDEYLEVLGNKLIALMGDNALVVRFSNAKFGILIEDYQHLDDKAFETLIVTRCQSICDISNSPIELSGDVKVNKNFSIGVSELNTKYTSYFAMEIATETAMHQAAKYSNSKYIFATTAITDKLLTRKLIIDEFPQAIAKQKIVLHYQPQFCLAKNTLMGVEALSRWHHPELGQISPALFVSIAEDVGLQFEFDLSVFKQTCQQINTWLAQDLNVPRVSINISFKTLEMSAFVERITDIIDNTKCPTQLIEIEVTETTSINNLDSLIETIGKVKMLGIHIAIDDFGAGYSSLSLIRTLHQSIDKLKLDKSLIENLCHTTIDQEFVKQIIELGNVLGLDVLAEGIEQKEQQLLLQKLGCKYGQGYFFAKPLPPQKVAQLFSTQ